MTNSDLEYNVRNICKITWNDKDTDERIASITEDAIVHMHDLLGMSGEPSPDELDVAFGRDENDFLCTIAIEDHCCVPQDRIYMKDSVDGKNKWTDIGGIIDQIKLNTGSGDVMYSGRTWHGILEGKVLCPDTGQDYLVCCQEKQIRS